MSVSTAVYICGYHDGMAQLYLDYARSPEHTHDGDPLGHVEMAQLTGRSISAVYKWFERKVLPPADGPVVNDLPTWRRRTFLAWAYRQKFTRRTQDGVPLPCHEEAERWASQVPTEAVTPLRDIEPRQRRAPLVAARLREPQPVPMSAEAERWPEPDLSKWVMPKRAQLLKPAEPETTKVAPTRPAVRARTAEDLAAEREAKRSAARKERAEQIHGTTTSYSNYGCRCDLCVEAMRRYNREYRRTHKRDRRKPPAG